MASQGPNSVGIGSNFGEGSLDWTNPNYIVTEGTDYSFCFTDGATKYLRGSAFGFSIPSAIINGIYVEIKRASDGSDKYMYVKDYAVKIIKPGPIIGSINKANIIDRWPIPPTYAGYGGNSDLWGETWSASDINNDEFGVGLSALSGGLADKGTPYVYHIRITVYYTEGGGSTSAIKSVNGLAKASIKSVDGLAIASVKSINSLA